MLTDSQTVDANDAAPENIQGISVDEAITAVMDGDFASIDLFLHQSVLPALLWASVGLAVLFIGYFVANYLSRVISRPIRNRIDETLGRFCGTVIFYTVMGGLVASVASKLGAPLGGLAALIAAAGFAIGLAFQGTLSNFAAGVLMIVFRPFKVGDMVNVAGIAGKVNEIDLFTTTLDTPDNRRLIIPNSSISSSTIENISYHAHRRAEVLVGVEYAADLDQTREALQRAVDCFADQMIPGEGRGSAVVLAGLGDSAVQWKVRLWVAGTDYWPMQECLTGEVKRQLDRAGIGIPFPQMDVHVRQTVTQDIRPTTRPRMRPARRAQAANEPPSMRRAS
ncbi:mechanosensitive ion channel [Roseiconus nitratireducens]|uniref:Mechanosensitive ion channel n=1 Tax=Roseiconus nitratireducens TaxID=2605748 RepID=A0A5M6D9X3_9BACT|nr:mechanosensitive ion channel domain-containing protein [Roseiconus nitratireducens]KAA5542759.1 mechanosensitive ion channel [Roseiconus nitratireducens]